LKSESLLKAEILCRGVNFLPEALEYAHEMKAKQQNLCYNAPQDYQNFRPQELAITGEDSYTTTVSCVSVSTKREPVTIDSQNGQLVARIGDAVQAGVSLAYVKEPDYYTKSTSGGIRINTLVSACGQDELNIVPWRGCGLTTSCSFCGVNAIANVTDKHSGFSAQELGRTSRSWIEQKSSYLANLYEAVSVALEDACYERHLHVIMVSGSLPKEGLDLQAEIYSEIAASLAPLVQERSTEGIVAVITPPHSIDRLEQMMNSGIRVAVFNLEVALEPWRSKYCVGKTSLGRRFIEDRLEAAVPIFGHGNVWSNFVFGLEPTEGLLELCEELSVRGIVPGANVLHLDHGHRLDCGVPTLENILWFYNRLSDIYRRHNLSPYYCQNALRTSLAWEAFDGRL